MIYLHLSGFSVFIIFDLFYGYNAVASVSFNQPTYSVNESDGMVQLVLLLSNQSTTDITVQVIDSDNSAMSK